ncbi:MAG: hypothetical protein LBT00_08480 [Spirochaetaceae bacterium]|jgi:hypothetical protein|nr:hypothetical protein [Spirochaetaceae bacterium]
MLEMTAEEALEQGKNLNFQQVWVALMETRAQFKETDRKIAELAKETDRKIVELAKETDRKIAEYANEAAKEAAERSKEFDRKMADYARESAEEAKKAWQIITEVGRKQAETAAQLKKLDEKVDRMCGNVGGLNRSLGELIETLIAARLWRKFPDYDFQRAYQRIPLYDEKRQVRTDVDILLVDTTICMAVEVKRELNRKDDVDDHVKRMGLIRRYPPEQVCGKQLLGAMAGGVVDPEVRDYAHKCGFHVLELTGETVSLVPPPEGFAPQNW